MSRVGKLPVTIPEGIEVDFTKGILKVKGKKGELALSIHASMKIKVNDNEIVIERPSDNKEHRSLHGTTRSLIQNMITGLTDGYEKELKIIGVGYKAENKGKAVLFQLGFAHPIYFVPPDGITIDVPEPTVIKVGGIDKQLVGQVAAKVRSLRPPEPYQGKGIRYTDEYVRRKAGKVTV